MAMESSPIECVYPQPGWVEQDANAIWRAQIDATRRTLNAANATARDVAAIGITNQRETTVVWDRRTGEPVSPAIVWQCRRTAAFCDALEPRETIERKTGLVIDAYFSASKIRWILDHVQARPADLLFGNVDTWLIWKLTNGASHVTDFTNASRTMLMNLAAGEWDDELLTIFGVPREMMPKIVRIVGHLRRRGGGTSGQPDPHCGHRGGSAGGAVRTGLLFARPLEKHLWHRMFCADAFGQRCAVSKNRLLSTRAASADGTAQFAVEGSVFIAGAAVQWLRDKMQIISTAAESESIAASVPDTGGAYFVPAFVGLGAPHWDSAARGIFSGITAGTDRARLVRAALESIAYQTRELVQAMESDSGHKLKEFRVDGGATANNFLMQFQADILGSPLVRPAEIETTALGAAYLAGLSTGFFKSLDELQKFWRAERVFEPKMSVDQREELFRGWKTAVARCRMA